MGRALFLLTCCSCALALNPALDISQYAHTPWRTRDGFPKGLISSIAQTPDGYLWLGTEFGLVRFDGVRNASWQAPPGQHLPSSLIRSLLVTRDGTLWIGTLEGLASWKGGRLAQYDELAGQDVRRLLEDHEGSVWAATSRMPTGRLCAIRKGNVQCYGEDGALGRGVVGLHEDSKGNIWAGVRDGLWRWKPDPPKFYPLPPEPDGFQHFSESDDGALLISTGSGIRRFVEGKTQALPGGLTKFKAQSMLRDREGSLWIGSHGQGLLHVHKERTDGFTQSGGMTGDYVSVLFEDREGSIWATTTEGLDRFRDYAVPTFSVNQGLSNAGVSAVLAARDGSVWLNSLGGLNRWVNGRFTRGGSAEGVGSIFQDSRARIWISTLGGFGYLENDRFVPMPGIPGGVVRSIAEDTARNLWIAHQDLGLFRLTRDDQIQQNPWAGLGRGGYATALAADPVRGELWLGFFRGGVANFKDGRVLASYTDTDGLGKGRVNEARFDPDGTLWAATEGGLSRLKNGRIATLTSDNGLPCDAVHWVTEDDDHSFWLQMTCGLVRIARSELDAWAAAVDNSGNANRVAQATVFDSSDGVRSRAVAIGYSPRVTKSSDGKLWFVAEDGVRVFDPRHLPFNKLPPPVHIEQIVANRKTYTADAAVRLPPLTRDLEIDYTALSLVAPEKLRFRYKLEAHDSDWQEAGNRRQAFYGDLSPRNYRFRVMASNNSGVWNDAGASFDFSVDPAYYQTRWFQASCVAAFLALLAGLYHLRMKQVEQHFRIRMEERVNERTRIARDFHDTLLQSFQGVLMKLSAVTNQLPDRPEVARQTLEKVIEQARQAFTEGRDAVQGLRSTTMVTNNLVRAITMLGEELATEYPGAGCPEFRVQVQGTSRELVPIVRDEVYRIACEAVRNACRHAQAAWIEVEIRYGDRQFRLRVRDNGKGIDPKIVAEGGRVGHHGLPGMQERAKLAGGKLTVLSRPDSGTEVHLKVPGPFAYLKSPIAGRSSSSGKGTS